jgi:hypothetical protein
MPVTVDKIGVPATDDAPEAVVAPELRQAQKAALWAPCPAPGRPHFAFEVIYG